MHQCEKINVSDWWEKKEINNKIYYQANYNNKR